MDEVTKLRSELERKMAVINEMFHRLQGHEMAEKQLIEERSALYRKVDQLESDLRVQTERREKAETHAISLARLINHMEDLLQNAIVQLDELGLENATSVKIKKLLMTNSRSVEDRAQAGNGADV